MMVSPELISASSAPSASPLNSCETRLGQLIMKGARGPDCQSGVVRTRKSTPQEVDHSLRRHELVCTSSIFAEAAAECVWLLHQALAGHDLDDVVIILLILHILFHLAFDDDDRTDALVILLAIVHIADEG